MRHDYVIKENVYTECRSIMITISEDTIAFTESKILKCV